MTTAGVSSDRIFERLSDPMDPFAITPMPDDDAVGPGTIDLRIGAIFLTAERSSISYVDSEEPWGASRVFTEVRIRPDAHFFMQPHQIVLASTLEYISMPADLSALIQSRSTFGRMGLIAATASFIGPGFKGCPTLEIVNAGEVPIGLKPYSPICQLILLSTNEPNPKPSRYQCATRPNFARAR